MRKNECVEAILDELSRFGIKGETRQRSKHIEVFWLHDGHRRGIVTSATTGDFRAHLNARSQCRRILRSDGITSPVQKSAFVRAISMPNAKVETQDQRLNRMEENINVLTDMMFELHERLDGMNVTVNFGTAPKTEGHRRTKKTRVMLLQNMFHMQWVTADKIAERIGSTKAKVQSLLWYYRKLGMVENMKTEKKKKTGLWRRTVELPEDANLEKFTIEGLRKQQHDG